jgi:ferritin-like metal-binding protein YciE
MVGPIGLKTAGSSIPEAHSMEMKVMEDLFLQELGELYGAEQQIVKALPKMVKAAHDKKLQGAFESHLSQTEKHIERLETIFGMLRRDQQTGDCEPVSEIIKQGDALIAIKDAEPSVLDAALISTAQKVEHYEIALYGSARSHAQLLGYIAVGKLLADTLREEEETDALLTQLATKRVNLSATKAPFSDARTGTRGADGSTGLGMGALLIGAGMGAVIAMLYAPQSGSKSRSQLKGKAEELGKEWGGRAQELINQSR